MGEGLCRLPFTPFNDDLDTTVVLHAIKSGVYKSHPATLVILTLHFPAFQKIEQVCLEVSLKQVGDQTSPNRPTFVSYGPLLVYKPPTRQSFDSSRWSELAWVAIYRKALDKLTVIVHGAEAKPHSIPLYLRVGFVFLHGSAAAVELRCVPSTPHLRRALVWRRAEVDPCQIDLRGSYPDAKVTCARDDGQPCAQSCEEFGPEHMTPAGWKERLKESQIGDWVAGSAQMVGGCQSLMVWADACRGGVAMSDDRERRRSLMYISFL